MYLRMLSLTFEPFSCTIYGEVNSHYYVFFFIHIWEVIGSDGSLLLPCTMELTGQCFVTADMSQYISVLLSVQSVYTFCTFQVRVP